MFNLPNLDTLTRSREGVFMSVLGLDGKPVEVVKDQPARLKLLGPDSPEYRRGNRALVRQRMLYAATTADEYDAEEAAIIDLLVNCTVGWEGMFDAKLKPLPFSAESVRALYEGYPAIRDQVDVFIADRRRFTKAS